MTTALVRAVPQEVPTLAPRNDLFGTAVRPGAVLVRVRRPAADVPSLDDIVDQWGVQSFPASDPPANW
jgi:hypothetical protein